MFMYVWACRRFILKGTRIISLSNEIVNSVTLKLCRGEMEVLVVLAHLLCCRVMVVRVFQSMSTCLYMCTQMKVANL